MKTHTDGIWVSDSREKQTVKALTEHIVSCGYSAVTQNADNFNYPYEFAKGDIKLSCRLVDFVEFTDITVTDNHPLVPVDGKVITVLPEFWGQWHFKPVFVDRVATHGYNCFMSRERPERDRVFELLQNRNILSHAFVSCLASSYDTVHRQDTLEQCIIDSNVSLVVETYTSFSQIVFSEKIFRALQLPRPWLIYCSPNSIALLKNYGFDMLEDYVDIAYDKMDIHWNRLDVILDQMETFIDRQYTRRDYERFEQAATHNQQLLIQFARDWPIKLDCVKLDIKHPELDWGEDD